MVDAATHRSQLLELAAIGADLALIVAQPDPTPAAGAESGPSDLTIPIYLGRFMRWSLLNSALATVFILIVAAAAIYGVVMLAYSLGEVD